MKYNEYIIEIATTDFESTKNAVAGGANRIELCANLGEGGTTPSFGVIKKCREEFDIPIYPIVRIRGGDFLYTDEEFDCMLEDAMNCKRLECDGVVVGFLKQNGEIDKERTTKIIEAVYPLGVTFHRAFDRCKNPHKAVEVLIELGCERILTSGQELTAIKGSQLIAELREIAAKKIIIMPGSGIRADNIRQLAETTGCTEFHSSLRTTVPSKMKYITAAFQGDEESISHSGIRPSDVASLIKALS